MKPPEKKRDLDARIEEAQARLKDLRAVARKQARRDETRRKIIYGAAILEIVARWRDGEGKSETKKAEEASKADRMMLALHKMITRESDRGFLGIDTDG
ncbi:hypothetical protein [Limimaricola litoreus]|uniref:Mobilization protein n=1 Tax=Limimaricola litoreus TaxID=2955316 RepID=A0A9X2JP63_9RHOB|nr:hypothetical protein [Limimaricola litoreus]MCP1167775.1 hypothetical protein [Limimaricola litoreus]